MIIQKKRLHDWFPMMEVCRRCGRTLLQETEQMTSCPPDAELKEREEWKQQAEIVTRIMRDENR